MAFRKICMVIAVMFTMMFLLSENVFAMTFSQPVKIGYAGGKPFIGQDLRFKGGYFIEGASYNSGNLVTHGKDRHYETYKEGLARWGEGKDALYCKYDTNTPADSRGISYGLQFGGKDNYLISEAMWRTISKIDTDEGITLYVLYSRYKHNHPYLTILGCRKDGSWVKYIDVNLDFSKKYFGDNFSEVIYGPEDWNKSGDISTYIRCNVDTLIVPYHVFANNPRRKIESGEFRFKWDDAAQWFGVENVVY